MESNDTTTDIIELKSRATTTGGSVAEELGNFTQLSTDDETTTMTAATVVQNITENILTQIINNLTTTLSWKMSNASSTDSWREEAMDNLNSWSNELSNITLSSALTSPNFQPNNHMITQNSHNESNTANIGYQPPGKMEALVIICIVAFILVVVAKYLGCHFCACCSSSESNTDHNHQAQRTRIQNVLHRPEYNRPLQYAVYSRPTTAQINQVDARGYGYAGETEEEEMAKVFTRRDDHVVDAPPDYNSLVPPSYATPYNYYTYAGNANASNVGDVQL